VKAKHTSVKKILRTVRGPLASTGEC